MFAMGYPIASTNVASFVILLIPAVILASCTTNHTDNAALRRGASQRVPAAMSLNRSMTPCRPPKISQRAKTKAPSQKLP